MRVIRNRLIPVKGFKCVNLFGVLFVRTGCVMQTADMNHEAIHTAQMKEMLYVFFYAAYILEWLYHLLICHDSRKAYYRISFEKEAYGNQSDADYLKNRKMYNQYRKELNHGTDRN